MMINYVAYDETSKLIGGFLQEVQPAHADCYIEVTEEQRLTWYLYRANEARDGIELIPEVPPEVPAEDPAEDPAEVPVELPPEDPTEE